MEIKDLVISKELAIFLDGKFPGRTAAFYWNVNLEDDSKTTLDFKERVIDNGHLKSYPAYTIAELGDLIKPYWLEFDTLHEHDLPAELDLDKMDRDAMVAKVFQPNYWGELLKFAIEKDLLKAQPTA